MLGLVLYDGPSMIDGKPIIVVAIGFSNASSNRKTGEMIQVYILRKDINPLEAVQIGEDYSICGNCQHRGKVVTSDLTGLKTNVERSCYVVLMHGPRIVYDAYLRGRYDKVTPAQARKHLFNKQVRLGAYGDPAAVPLRVWQSALKDTSERTGYTHQWRDPKFQGYRDYCMASVDTQQEQEAAEALGWRTFRVRRAAEPLLKGEITCPASKEAGHRTKCGDCLLCSGSDKKAKNIAIIAHGTQGVNFVKRKLVKT